MHVIFWLGLLAALASSEFAPRGGVVRPFGQAAISIMLAAGLCLWAVGTSRRLCRRLRLLDVRKSDLGDRLRRRRLVFMGLWSAGTGLVLGPLQWPQVARDSFGLARTLLIDEIAVVLPVAVPLLVWWCSQRRIETAVSDWLGHAAPPELPRREWHDLRSAGLPVVMPVVAVIAARDVCAMSGVTQLAPWFEWVAVAAVLAMAAFGFPLWIRYACGTSPLGRQPLRGKLIQAGRRYGIGDYLIWTAPQTPYAAVTGIVPGLRYVLLSNRLVHRCSDEEVEAIVAHELGHVHHGHVLLRLGVVAAPLAVLAGPLSAEYLPGTTGGQSTLSMKVLPLVLAVCAGYIVGVVRPYWRLLEHQADSFALWRGPVAGAAVDCGDKKIGQELSVYLAALEKLGPSTSKFRSWQSLFHPDLAQRRVFLQRTACHPGRFDRFTSQMRLLNGLLATLLLASVAWAALDAWTP